MSPLDLAVAGVFGRQIGLVTRGQALDIGLTDRQIDHRVRSGIWIRVRSAVYRHHLAAPSWRQELLAVCLSPHTVASHVSAARLWDLDGCRASDLEVTRPKGRSVAWRGVRVHESTQWDRIDAVQLQGIPTTGIGRTLIDLADVVSLARLRQATNDALRRQLITRSGLDETLARHARRGRNGAGPFRAHLETRRNEQPLPLSDWSDRVSDLLEQAGLPRPVPEHRVADDQGFVAFIDLAYPDRMIGFELDSKAWHFNYDSFVSDPDRRNKLEDRGWSMRTFTWSAFRNQPDELVRSATRLFHSRNRSQSPHQR